MEIDSISNFVMSSINGDDVLTLNSSPVSGLRLAKKQSN